MTADSPLIAELPVGFQRFHRRQFFNYQLNRAHSLGYAHAEELRDVVQRVRRPTECADVFGSLSKVAEDEGRLRNATSYQRISEFFTPPEGSLSKVAAYTRYRELFDRGFARSGVVRHDVPFANDSLPAYAYPASTGASLGTVVLHGGFDSLIEEFFAIWQRIAFAGFDVIAFEGPGQGGARIAGLTFDHDWEKPVGAVLDHFELDSVALIGISMGGYWALRAAAFEPRVDRVVSWPPVYDWLLRAPAPLRSMTRRMLERRGFMNWSVRVRTRLVPTLQQVVGQALYLVDGDEPMDAVDWFLGMNTHHLSSERVRQDVLIMAGERDRFQPLKMARAQEAALTSARSVTTRVFTAAEHADQHCQMGNLDLACEVLTTWLKSELDRSRR